MSPGKQASTSEAAAPMAAGARLEAMRRRVRLSRLAVWTVIAAGPIALGVAITSTSTTVEAATEAKPSRRAHHGGGRRPVRLCAAVRQHVVAQQRG